MRVNSKIQIGNTTQYYLKNTMFQVTKKGNETIKTVVDLRTNKTIKQWVENLCKKCPDFDCLWCNKNI